MFKTKSKKQLKSVIISIIDEKEGKEVSSREFLIPENGKCKIHTIGGDFLISDGDGDTVYQINWQAGFSQEYSFIYKTK
jgi:hypothetical protein